MIRLRARAPRVLALALILILCLAGVRSIISPRPATPQALAAAADTDYDLGAAAFAQSFSSTYLTWGGDLTQGDRNLALRPFLAQGMEADGGLVPGRGTEQTVHGTQVAEESSVGEVTDVVVAAETSNGTRYLSVPVTRSGRGLLTVVSYPALVGPPATDTARPELTLEPVADQQLVTVVSRALGNYLAGHAANLRADLTPEAVVSLPGQELELQEINSVNWLVPRRTVDVEVDARDEQGARMTLTYQAGVVHHDRWYVASIQFDPTLKGGM
jgi:hypothetical protein